MLREDINNLSAHNEVFELTWYGWQARSKLWVASDCAITPNGDYLLPDRNGVIWWADSGYKMADRDSEGEKFVQAPPRWRPNEVLAFRERSVSEVDPNWQGVAYRLVPRLNGEMLEEPRVIADLFLELGGRMCETVGSREGFLIVGAMLAFAAAPEMYARENWFPGIWFHGERGGGKTTLARVAMGLWGSKLESGANLNTCSKVGMQILAQQFCNLPVWYEEYKNTLDTAKIEFVKSLYNRELAAKKEFGNVRREIRTNGIVSGEHTSGDSATMQRFPHVNIARERRKAEHKTWFQNNGPFFFCLGRHALRNRTRYVELFDKHMASWVAEASLAGADERSRDVHGVGYAGYMAMAELFGIVAGADEAAFRRELVAATVRAVRNAKETVNINLFWQQVIVAWQAGAFEYGEKAKLFFKAKKQLADGGHPPGAVNQGPGFNPDRVNLKPWETYYLYIDFNAVIARLQEHLRKQGQVMALGKRDLQEQLSKELYWVPGKHGDGHKERMGKGKAPTRVWCINLDRHKEFGYQPVSDEELMESREELASSEWVDPRFGELYKIAFEVEREALAPEMV